jgi:lipopolysaccharide cholinephosphotransferase
MIKKNQQVNIKYAQEIMLELLKIIDKICQDNNIEYWLDHGTLLGAVRHKGFIPWDDDLDICLIKDDYDRLIELLTKESSRNSEIYLMYGSKGKIKYWCNYLCSTKLLWGESITKLDSCRIDIFPMKSVRRSEEGLNRAIVNKANYYINGESNMWIFFQRKKFTIEKLKEKFLFLSYYNDEYMNHESGNNNGDLITYSFGDTLSKSDDYFEYSRIFPLKKIEFEGLSFYSPNDPDYYLELLYGEYRSMPKIQDRIPVRNYFVLNDNHKLSYESTRRYIENANQVFIERNLITYKIRRIFWYFKLFVKKYL